MLPPIERDEDMDRTYIPLPGGWEIQTKGRGSAFRLLDTKTGERHAIGGHRYAHEILERMALEIRAAFEAGQARAYRFYNCAGCGETAAPEPDGFCSVECLIRPGRLSDDDGGNDE